MTQLDPAMLQQLVQMAAADPRGLAGLAERISRAVGKVSRASLSTVLRGKYPAGITKLESKLQLFLGQGSVECPYLRQQIMVRECHDFRCRPMPTSDADALRHWSTCQGCIFGNIVTAKPRETTHVA